MLELLNGLVLIPSLGIQIEPKTALLAFHMACLVLGVGAATLLGFRVARLFIFNRVIEVEDFAIISYVSKIVALGLLLTWISGGLYLAHVYAANPLIVEDPTVFVMVGIICVLTVNAALIHAVVIPQVRRNVHSTLFARTYMEKCVVFLVSGSVSVVSWYFPILLGAAKEMNSAVSFGQSVILYLAPALLALLLISSAKLAVLSWTKRTSALERLGATCAPLAALRSGQPNTRLVVAHSEPYLRMPHHFHSELPKPAVALTRRSA